MSEIAVAVAGAVATIAAAAFAYLGQREARRSRRAAETTVQQVDGSNGHTLHETVERIRVDNEQTHAVLMQHVAQLQTKVAANAQELAQFRRALTAHMDDEMGDAGSYATMLHAVNDLREDMLGVRLKVEQTWEFMRGYDGSELPDGEAVNELVQTVELLDHQVDEITSRLHRLESETGPPS